MDCADIQERTTAYFAEELSPVEREQVLTHLATCSACRQETEALHSTWELLGTWREVSPSPALESRVLANLRHELPEAVVGRQPKVQPRLVAASALVAALLSILNALLLPYEKAAALCADTLRSLDPFVGLSDAPIYFLVGSVYGLVPLLCVGFVSGRWIRGQAPTQGLLTGCLFIVLMIPFLLAACSMLPILLTVALLAGLTVGAISGGIGGSWIGTYAARAA